MRKKITLVLVAVFVAMFLTACSTTITAEEYNELENIASEIKNAEGEYQLPDGYNVEYANPTKTNEITVTKKEPSTGKGDTIRATFDIAKNEPELISIEQGFDIFALSEGVIIVIITIMLLVIVSALKNNNNC